MEAQDGSPHQGEDWAPARFLARARGVFFPQAGVALPVVLVFDQPVAADGLREKGVTSLMTFETSVVFVPVADPFVRNSSAEAGLRELVKGAQDEAIDNERGLGHQCCHGRLTLPKPTLMFEQFLKSPENLNLGGFPGKAGRRKG
jgi:hypothetical protein